MSCIARYTEVLEWLDEVTQQAMFVQWGTVRVTAMSEFEFQSERLYLVAGAVINGTLVEVRHLIGTIVIDSEREAFQARYLTLKDRIERATKDVGLELRAGWWIEVAGVPRRFA